MLMMRIRKVSMAMHNWRMFMPVTVRLARLVRLFGRIVVVLVVFVMNMFVRVRDRRVLMFMIVLFADMQPYTQRHQCARHQ